MAPNRGKQAAAGRAERPRELIDSNRTHAAGVDLLSDGEDDEKDEDDKADEDARMQAEWMARGWEGWDEEWSDMDDEEEREEE